MPQQTVVDRALGVARLDFTPARQQPSAMRVVLATAAALAGSLGADALLVVLGTAVFPSTRGYVHFVFTDYAKLTIIGVLIACAGWPVVTRITSAPQWLFLRLAILTTLVLYLPDLYLLMLGDSVEAVLVLMVMHLAIAVVTYCALVWLAPVRPDPAGPRRGAHRHAGPAA